jgi:RHS repeat-associated protein
MRRPPIAGSCSRLRKWFAHGLVALLIVVVGQSTASAQTIEYYATDAVGSVRVVFDANGNVVGRSDYLPFGEAVGQTDRMPSQRYTGQERDSETGSDHFNARQMAPRVGRMQRVDPVGGKTARPQSWNRYAYVRNSPLTLVDPTGMDDTPTFTVSVDASCNPASPAYSPKWCPPTQIIRVPGGKKPQKPGSSVDPNGLTRVPTSSGSSGGYRPWIPSGVGFGSGQGTRVSDRNGEITISTEGERAAERQEARVEAACNDDAQEFQISIAASGFAGAPFVAGPVPVAMEAGGSVFFSPVTNRFGVSGGFGAGVGVGYGAGLTVGASSGSVSGEGVHTQASIPSLSLGVSTDILVSEVTGFEFAIPPIPNAGVGGGVTTVKTVSTWLTQGSCGDK